MSPETLQPIHKTKLMSMSALPNIGIYRTLFLESEEIKKTITKTPTTKSNYGQYISMWSANGVRDEQKQILVDVCKLED